MSLYSVPLRLAGKRKATMALHEDVIARIRAGQSVFLTGPGGTGKTHNSRLVLSNSADLDWIICGTTGVAALHLKDGQTLHSAFMLPTNENPSLKEWVHKSRALLNVARHHPRVKVLVERTKTSKALFVDEISMCSAWLLEMLDIRLRVWRNDNRPFGGLPALFVGDAAQLAPVYAPKSIPPPHPRQQLYFFESPVWEAMRIHVVQLDHIYRQQDASFAALCNHLRRGGRLNNEQRQMLRARCITGEPAEDAMRIMVKRDDVHACNQQKLNALDSPAVTTPFPSGLIGSTQDLKNSLLKDVRENLYIRYDQKVQEFRVGARVMLVVNAKTAEDAKYVNGDRGTVVGFRARSAAASARTLVRVEDRREHLYDGDPGVIPVVHFDRTDEWIAVHPHEYERKITGRKSDGTDEVKEFATMMATPLCLAWSSTVQKVQGATITGKVHIDCTLMDFIPASFYVALSRATELGNVTLSNFKAEGRCYLRAIQFYDGAYKVPDSNILNLIAARVQDSGEVNFDDLTPDIPLENEHKAKKRRN